MTDLWEDARRSLAAVDPRGITSLEAGDRMTTRDPAAARDLIGAVLSPHHLEIADQDEFRARLAHGRSGGLALLELAYGTGVRIRRDPVSDYTAVLIPVTGRIRLGRAGSTAEPYERMAVVGDGDPLDVEWEPGTRALILRIDCAALSAALSAFFGLGGEVGALRVPSTTLTGAAGFAIYGVVQQLARLFADAGSPDHAPSIVARHLVQQALLTALLVIPHSHSRQLASARPAVRSSRIRDALDLIAAEPSAERTIHDLAAELGVGVRALELGFRRELDTTPTEYLRSSRLERIHEELTMSEPGVTTVSAIAAKWGFAHHSRFARAYRDRFGEAPSATLHS